eukprot:TRINITY_DN18316_c0_g3_i1.p1 TRINITY_DN18316_c0_g3~~TRINITY_DN18316_c0_g3_i1.p1  ORF type:complete len:262 (-),score=36.91 TRINITY_DN18316_c0_g3_i1:147-932(-)
MLLCCCHTFFRPAYNFLGCFRLSFGVKLLMWPHLILSFYYVGYVVSMLVSDDGGFFDVSQILATLMSLIGIPIIALGLFGVYNRLEPQVRTYFYYLAVCVAIDLYYIVEMFILRDSCVHVKLINHMRGGRAFACGVAQSISNVSAVVMVLGSLYMLYIVWSWCEAAEVGHIDWALQSLLAMSEGKPPVKTRSQQMGLNTEIVGDTVSAGMNAVNSVGAGANIVYGAVVQGLKDTRVEATHLIDDKLEDLENFTTGRRNRFY